MDLIDHRLLWFDERLSGPVVARRLSAKSSTVLMERASVITDANYGLGQYRGDHTLVRSSLLFHWSR
jgi:hypothetical protein